MTTIDDIGAGKYLSLTTFKKDGTAVATPVWLVRRHHELLVLTQADSGKVKRIRNNPNVLVAPCDARGRVKSEPIPAVAELQDATQTHLTASLVQHRYGFMGRIIGWLNELRSGSSEHVGVTITVT